MRDSVAESGVLSPLFKVDGEILPVVTKYDLPVVVEIAQAGTDWPQRELAKLAGTDISIVEAFSPDDIAKIDGVAFCDLGADGDVSSFAKSLYGRRAGYAVSLLDSPRAVRASRRSVASSNSCPRRAGIDSVDRIFVASLRVASTRSRT